MLTHYILYLYRKHRKVQPWQAMLQITFSVCLEDQKRGAEIKIIPVSNLSSSGYFLPVPILYTFDRQEQGVRYRSQFLLFHRIHHRQIPTVSTTKTSPVSPVINPAIVIPRRPPQTGRAQHDNPTPHPHHHPHRLPRLWKNHTPPKPPPPITFHLQARAAQKRVR